jgi:hypothetical protein
MKVDLWKMWDFPFLLECFEQKNWLLLRMEACRDLVSHLLQIA